MTRVARRFVGAAGLACAARALGAQPPDPGQTLRNAVANAPEALAASGGQLTAYYAVPEIPATVLLGATPAGITRPVTPKDLATSLIEGIDASGNVRQGLALETSLSLFRAFRVPLATYQGSRRARLWSNTALSLATVRVASDTQSTNLAWGVRIPLYDGGDPFASAAYTTRLGAALLTCAPPMPPPFVPRNTGLSEAQVVAQRDSIDKATKVLQEKRAAEQRACLGNVATEIGKRAADSLWNAPRLVLAYAGSMQLAQSSLGGRRRLEDRVWAVGALPLTAIAGNSPFGRSSQGIGYLDYTRRHARDDVRASNGASYGARLNVGSATFNGFGELLGEWRSDAAEGAKRSTTAFSGGVEFLAAAGTWISTGIGRRYSDAAKADRTVLLANIRWGISSKPFLGAGPAAP